MPNGPWYPRPAPSQPPGPASGFQVRAVARPRSAAAAAAAAAAAKAAASCGAAQCWSLLK